MYPTPDPPEREPDPLDALLRSARWPQADPDALERLRQQWHAVRSEGAVESGTIVPASVPQISTSGRRRLVISVAMALAAAVVLAGWGLFQLVPARLPWIRPGESQSAIATKRPAPIGDSDLANHPVGNPKAPTEDENQSPRQETNDAQATDTDAPISRPATAYELVVFAASTPDRSHVTKQDEKDRPQESGTTSPPTDKQRNATRKSPRERKAERIELVRQDVEALLNRLTGDPKIDVDSAAESLRDQWSLAEPMVARIVQTETGPRQAAATAVLCRLATPRSLPLVRQLINVPWAHADAARCLGRLENPQTVRSLIRTEADAKVKEALARALFERNDPTAMAAFVTMVNDPVDGPTALAVAAQADYQAVELLLGFLSSPRHADRISAAILLGRLNHPQVTERLVAQVVNNVSRQESLVALLSSSEPRAQQFLGMARRDLELRSAIQGAEYQLKHLVNDIPTEERPT